MNELRVESTTLRAVAYDDRRRVLQLEFRTPGHLPLLWRSGGGL